MEKRLLMYLLCLMIVCFGISGCSPRTETFSVEKETAVSFTINLVPLSNFLYYDRSTLIVYFWNGYTSVDASTTPSPYYAPNGFPYKYNPKTTKLEQIDVYEPVLVDIETLEDK